MTKILIAAVFCALCSLASFAQSDSIEKDFEANKLKYTLEKFIEGEDATSGYDYFIYKNKAQIVKVREIWSSSYQPTFRAGDYYYQNGELIALIRYTFDKKFYKTAEKGKNIPLKLVEKLFVTNGRLTGWTENGKIIAATDKRWQEKETETLEAGKDQLENYKFLKETN